MIIEIIATVILFGWIVWLGTKYPCPGGGYGGGDIG